MEELYFEKKVRYIGIANVEIRHLLEIEKKCALLPHVIQIERNPLITQSELIAFCREKNICVQAYAPLGRMNPALTRQRCLKELGDKYEKTISQILLRWQIQTGVTPVVRSVRKARIVENMNLWDFHLTEGEVSEITALNQYFKYYDPRRYARYY